MREKLFLAKTGRTVPMQAILKSSNGSSLAPVGRWQGSAFLMSLPVIWFVRHNSGVGCKFQSGSNREGCRRGGSLSTWLSEARSMTAIAVETRTRFHDRFLSAERG